MSSPEEVTAIRARIESMRKHPPGRSDTIRGGEFGARTHWIGMPDILKVASRICGRQPT